MSSKIILFLAFIEGFSVIAIELMGGKILISYFGNSLIIWTSTIGITMTSLMLGYFIGGFISGNKNRLTLLFSLILISALWLTIIPAIVLPIINQFGDSNFYISSIYATTLLLATPLICLGAIPSILIEELTTNNKVGIASGKVFFISTIGAIIAALFLGFIIISKYGLSNPLIIYGIILAIITPILLWRVFENKIIFLLFSLPIFFTSFAQLRVKSESNSAYLSEGLQGQLKVFDKPGSIGKPRYLQINGVSQTRMFLDFNNPTLNQSGWWYVHLDAALASRQPKGSKALLMGFGGGSIALELVKLGMNLDVVEIDERLPAIAHDYFLFDTTNVNFYIDDARHFIKKNQDLKKYDLVVIDLLHGEVQPNHIFTLEGLRELRKIVSEQATIIVNYQSNYNEPEKPYLAIINTLWAAGFDAMVTNNKKDIPTDYIYIASPDKLPDNLFDKTHMNDCCFNNKDVQTFIKNPKVITKQSAIIKNSKVVILKDNTPILETMNKESIKSWRKNMVIQSEKTNIPLFK